MRPEVCSGLSDCSLHVIHLLSFQYRLYIGACCIMNELSPRIFLSSGSNICAVQMGHVQLEGPGSFPLGLSLSNVPNAIPFPGINAMQIFKMPCQHFLPLETVHHSLVSQIITVLCWLEPMLGYLCLGCKTCGNPLSSLGMWFMLACQESGRWWMRF